MIDKLKKLMGLTASDSDGEALNALRAANRLLKENNATWENVFTGLNEGHWQAEYKKTVKDYNVLVEKYNTLLRASLLTERKGSIFDIFS